MIPLGRSSAWCQTSLQQGTRICCQNLSQCRDSRDRARMPRTDWDCDRDTGGTRGSNQGGEELRKRRMDCLWKGMKA